MDRPANLGIGYRLPLHDFITSELGLRHLSFLELNAEISRHSSQLPVGEALAALFGRPVSLHLTDVPFLAPDIVPYMQRMREIGVLANNVGITTISCHLSESEGYVGPIRSFFRPSYSGALLELTRQRLSDIYNETGVRLRLENIACYGAQQADEMPESEFLETLSNACPGSVLFDLSNFLANNINGRGVNEEFPHHAIDHSPYVHFSGGRWVEDAYVDTHGDSVPAWQLDALRLVVRDHPQVKVLYERDIRFEMTEQIGQDMAAIEAVLRSS